jgi:hypothetical protein
MKTGVAQKMNKIAAQQLSRTMVSLNKRVEKEDPEKMRMFLTDIVEDESFPYEMRQACAKLRNGLSVGKTPEAIMNENIAEVAKTCESK